MNFQLEPIIVTGYHGTSRSAADKILADGFQSSENEWNWMGTEVYFWMNLDLLEQRGLKTLQDLAKSYQGQENVLELLNQRGANTGLVSRAVGGDRPEGDLRR